MLPHLRQEAYLDRATIGLQPGRLGYDSAVIMTVGAVCIDFALMLELLVGYPACIRTIATLRTSSISLLSKVLCNIRAGVAVVICITVVDVANPESMCL